MNTDTQNVPTVKCPTCRTAVRWNADSPYRPFCSRRCKLIDLGEWANERYSVAAAEDDSLSDLLER
ncbi:DNA gyrase inhibitor YacG [Neisseria lisongii]|uniref:DNA gyrase inhibitor YacG n=1 Tax=Neisseria lisongii TaxID=2912188 RepID=A0AAW5ANG9_9NEIS|nr:DNA gyrase inhibitor YacG [Neisseria lisongii]MCF7530079.1 DNA gyrase inhibitor YacG [Neisseria lisongii]